MDIISETNEKPDYLNGFDLSSEDDMIFQNMNSEQQEEDASNDKNDQVCDDLSSKMRKMMHFMILLKSWVIQKYMFIHLF